MGKRDSRLDNYIAQSAEFARPILRHLRETVHAACPGVEETLKWGHPSFIHHGILCGMASFKEHCAFGLPKSPLIEGMERSDEAMGQLGRIRTFSDLPSKKVLTGWIRQAMKLNESGAKIPRKNRTKPNPAPGVPADLAAALAKNANARKTFEGFSPSHRREYVEWIVEAKRDETKKTRLATTIEWLAKGKKRNWKYEKC